MARLPLSIIHVGNPAGNDPLKEFVQLFVFEDLNTSGYALVDRTFKEEGGVSNEFRHIYVFPNQDVKKNDIIDVYTGIGTNSVHDNLDGSTTYFFFWGSEQCVWNNQGGDRATLLRYTVEDDLVVPAAESK
jgi:hypothetical protein